MTCTVNGASWPSVTDTWSALTVTASVSSSAMLTVAVAVPRLTPVGSALSVSTASVAVNVSGPSASRSSLVCTVTVRVVCSAGTVTDTAACPV